MTEPLDPPRLVETDSAEGEPLRHLVRQGREDVGTPAEIEALAARLAPVFGPPTGAPPGAGPGATGAGAAAGTSAATVAKIGAVVAVAALAGAGVWLLRDRNAPTPVSENRTALPRTPEPNPVATPAAPAEPSPVPAPAQEPSPDATVEQQTTPPPSGARRAPIATTSEADLLGEAQAAVARDPAKALALTERHRRAYPAGILAQEREVIAIEALERLGRRSEAAARAERFLKRFPGSAHRSKIEAIVGSK